MNLNKNCISFISYFNNVIWKRNPKDCSIDNWSQNIKRNIDHQQWICFVVLVLNLKNSSFVGKIGGKWAACVLINSSLTEDKEGEEQNTNT